MMIPTEAEHDRVWGPPGSATRATYAPGGAGRCAWPDPGRGPASTSRSANEDFPRMIEASAGMAALFEAAGIPFTFSRARGDHTWAYAAPAMARLVGQWRADRP